jgi:hypothetical protein
MLKRKYWDFLCAELNRLVVAQLWEGGNEIGCWILVDGLNSCGCVMICELCKGTSKKWK